MRRTNSKREKPQSNETGGFKFAVTLLVALGTISYAVYNYVQTTPINPLGYVLFPILISAAPILAGGLLLYILIEGYSMGVHGDPNKKMRLKDKASSIYLITFFSFTVLFVFLLVYSMCTFFLAYLILLSPDLKIAIFYIVAPIVALIVFCCIVISLGIFFEWLDKRLSSKISRGYWKGFLISCFAFSIILVLIVPNLTPQGHVTVDMESTYYKNDAPIPVLIHVTGPNPGLSIKLQNLTKVYNLTLKPEHNPFETEFSNNSTLVGNALNYGTYNVFINTTNLSAGYYELKCIRKGYNKTYGVRWFYLLNSSQQSCIKE